MVDPDSEYLGQAGWDQLVQQSPASARRLARERLASGGLQPTERALALHALGRSLLELGDVGGAVDALRDALVASRDDACETAVPNAVAMTAAIVFAEAGAIDDAITTLEALTTTCTGHFCSISTSTWVPLEVTSNTGESLLRALSFSN